MPNEQEVKQAADELDAHVAEIIKWHFSPETGCPFWLDWAKEQNWNPIDEVSNFDDLCQKFPNFQDEWLRDLPNDVWVPKAIEDLKACLSSDNCPEHASEGFGPKGDKQCEYATLFDGIKENNLDF